MFILQERAVSCLIILIKIRTSFVIFVVYIYFTDTIKYVNYFIKKNEETSFFNWYVQRNKWRSCQFSNNMTFSIFSFMKSCYKNAPFLCVSTYYYLFLNIDVKHASTCTVHHTNIPSVFRYNMTFSFLSYIKFQYKAPNSNFEKQQHFVVLNIDTKHPYTWTCLTFWHSYAIVRSTSC